MTILYNVELKIFLFFFFFKKSLSYFFLPQKNKINVEREGRKSLSATVSTIFPSFASIPLLPRKEKEKK